MGADLMDSTDADALNIGIKAYNSKRNFGNSYDFINKGISTWRNCVATGSSSSDALLCMETSLALDASTITEQYEKEMNASITTNYKSDTTE